MVINMHIGSSSRMPATSPDAPAGVQATLSFNNAMGSLADWIFSGVLVRHPTLKLAYSEGQMGWIPYAMERADSVWKEFRGWAFDKDAVPEPPSTYFTRQVYACFFRDNFGLKNLEDVGVDNVTFETDYPHSDSTWPDTEDVFRDMVERPRRRHRLQAGPRQRHQDAVARPGLSVSRRGLPLRRWPPPPLVVAAPSVPSGGRS